MLGWGGRIRTSVWWNQNPLPYHLATPQYAVRESGRMSLAADSFRQRRSIEGVEVFQQAGTPIPVESDFRICPAKTPHFAAEIARFLIRNALAPGFARRDSTRRRVERAAVSWEDGNPMFQS